MSTLRRCCRATCLARQGMTLDQLGGLLALHPVAIEVHHAADGGLDAFRAAARDYLAAKDHFVIVNYLRKAIGQQTGGHISPLAAYDAKVDRFLILDVARYKYPPVWVTGIRPVRRHEHDRCVERQQDARLCSHRQVRCRDARAGAVTQLGGNQN